MTSSCAILIFDFPGFQILYQLAQLLFPGLDSETDHCSLYLTVAIDVEIGGGENGQCIIIIILYNGLGCGF